jgi:hypothetical protein
MQTFQSIRRLLLCILFGVQAGISNAANLPDAIKGIDEVVPKMCRMLELERSMYSVIRESGQSPEQFFARPDTDPDPKVQQVIKISKEIQITKNEMTVAFSKLKAVVAALKPEEQASFKQQFELQAKKCSK